MTPQMVDLLISPVKDIVTNNWGALAGLFGLFLSISILPRLIKKFTS